MEIPLNENDKDILFEFDTYDEFTKERLKLNYENTLKLWYSLPEDLTNIDDELIQRRTLRQQRRVFRKVKVLYVYSKLLKRTCLKKRIYSRGIRVCNDIFDMPSIHNESFYKVYQSLAHITLDFVNKGKRYDPKVNPEELFKAVHLLWTMIAMEVEFGIPLKMTDAIFGYNMLYPYTDDFVDCTSVSEKAKKEFAEAFHERLLIGQSNYDPKSHFNGRQSNVAELRLPLSLQPYADKIGKIFDMVKFIENDWTRHREHKCVYMSLATIHDSQIKSTLQHACPDGGYAPTMVQIEQVSAEKGGASLIAAGFLMEGQLTRAKMAYLEYLGFGMQLVDDLQDLELDMKNNHRTIFTQSIAEGQTLDAPTARLIQYCCRASAYEKFVADQLTHSDAETDVMQPHYVYVLLVKACIMLILEAASRVPQHFSKEFYRELSRLSVLPFNSLRRLHIEDKLITIVRNQWF